MTEDLFDRKGYEIRIQINKGIRADRLGYEGDLRKFCVRLDYMGPVTPCGTVEDPGAYPCVSSPWNGDFGLLERGGFFRSDRDEIWTSYWNRFLLRDPGILQSGLKMVYTVPERLAAIRPKLQVFAEEELLLQKTLSEAGTFTEIFETSRVGEAERSYLADAHRVLGLLLAEVKRVCEKYGLRYYLFCGSLLGEYREGEQIAWDDDVDVALPRRDFDALMKAAETEWGGSDKFRLVRPEDLGKKTFLDYMTRLFYTAEPVDVDFCRRIRGMEPSGLERRMPVDLYVLEDAFDSAFLHRVQTGLIRGVYALAMGHRGYFDPAEHRGAKPSTLFFLKCAVRVGRFLPLPFLLGIYRRLCRWNKSGKGQYCFQSNGYIGCVPMRFRKEWFGDGQTIRFAGLEVTSPADTEAYLRCQYRGSLTLPDLWYRVPSHWARRAR